MQKYNEYLEDGFYVIGTGFGLVFDFTVTIFHFCLFPIAILGWLNKEKDDET
jgi:hypothetical protein